MILEKTNRELYDAEWKIAQQDFPVSEYGMHESKRHTANRMLNTAIVALGNLEPTDNDCSYLVYKALRAQRIAL